MHKTVEQSIQNQTKMKVTTEKEERVANLIFASIYPLYWNRLEKHGRTKEEFHQVLEWFTGFDEDALQALIDEKATFRTFFQKATIHSIGPTLGHHSKTSSPPRIETHGSPTCGFNN